MYKDLAETIKEKNENNQKPLKLLLKNTSAFTSSGG